MEQENSLLCSKYVLIEPYPLTSLCMNTKIFFLLIVSDTQIKVEGK
jgi:hypothetical protein